MDLEHQLAGNQAQSMVDARRHPRFTFQASIRVYARDCEVVRGETVDLSQSGVAAMMRVEVPVGEVLPEMLRSTRLSGKGTHSATGFNSSNPAHLRTSSAALVAIWP